MRPQVGRARPRIKRIAERYREARTTLRTPTSGQSQRGLDWMNFFIADVQTGFGTFVAFYLAHLNWPQGLIGLALTVGRIAGAKFLAARWQTRCGGSVP